MLALSLWMPCVVCLVEHDADTLAFFDFSEEESKMEHKKEMDEKETFFLQFADGFKPVSSKKQRLFDDYFEYPKEVDREIFLPPPERRA